MDNKCPVPANEEERVAAVHAYRILDTAPEPEFDVTTRIASSLFGTPIALVALMDRDRLWFKSRHGLDLPQLDRDIAFCAHALMRPDELLVVDDLAADERFAQNPLVAQAPGIRFYAGAPIVDGQGRALGTLAVLDTKAREFSAEQRSLLHDLSVSVMTALEARRRATELAELAMTDGLTGLPNIRRFRMALAHEFRQAAKAGLTAGLMYLDLDGFKDINDRYGHAAGDEVLRIFAARMRSHVRQGETLARLGGDEFALVLEPGVDEVSAIQAAERISQIVGEPMPLSQGLSVQIGVSIGIAIDDAASIDTDVLVERADFALYTAKAHQSRRWHVFPRSADATVAVPAFALRSPPSAPRAATGRSAEPGRETADAMRADAQDLRAPIIRRSRDEPVHDPEAAGCEGCAGGIAPPFPFSMAFQPIVRWSRREVFAYEALVRGPANESAAWVLSKVNRRNRYAFDQSCRRTAIELSSRLGLLERGASLSINFMPGAMYEPQNCVRATLAAARRCNLPLDRLIFEVTEGEEVLEPAHLSKIFQVYREHGFRPAIDDFGAGYSGLNLLAEFQPSIIKLDRKLVSDIDSSPVRRSIVKGIQAVCADLGIVTIAEGIERSAEASALLDLGVDLFQGYLFARPGFERLPEPAWPDLAQAA